MILDAPGGGSGGPPETVDFQLGTFVPVYYPDDVKIIKERNIDSEQSMCEGEYKKDTGGKNRTFNITGIALTKNIWMLDAIAEAGEPMMLQSVKGSYEVLLEKLEVSGLIGWDGGEQSFWFDYSIDAVSTGRDERGETNFGIIHGVGQPESFGTATSTAEQPV